MQYVVSILIGIIFAFSINILLDFLISQRAVYNGTLRTLHIKSGRERHLSIQKYSLAWESIFHKKQFPVCQVCQQTIPYLRYGFGLSCRHCGTASRLRSRLLLFLFPLLTLSVTVFPIEGFRIADIYFLLAFYALVFIMDLEHRVILYPVTFAGILFGLYFGVIYHGLAATLLGAFAGGGIMLVFYWLGMVYLRIIRKSTDSDLDEVALGFGDVSLSFILGLILGWPGILGGLFFGILLGGVISAGLLIMRILAKKYAPNDLILPYAPFLILGAFLIMLL